MRFDEALKKFRGESVGGQLIVSHEGHNVLLGRHHDGYLIVDDNPEAQAIFAAGGGKLASDEDHEAVVEHKPRGRKSKAAAESAPEPEPAPVHHNVVVDDEVVTEDKLGAAEPE